MRLPGCCHRFKPLFLAWIAIITPILGRRSVIFENEEIEQVLPTRTLSQGASCLLEDSELFVLLGGLDLLIDENKTTVTPNESVDIILTYGNGTQESFADIRLRSSTLGPKFEARRWGHSVVNVPTSLFNDDDTLAKILCSFAVLGGAQSNALDLTIFNVMRTEEFFLDIMLQFEPEVSPAQRSFFAAFYNDYAESLNIFGGVTTDGEVLNDFWRFDVDNSVWLQQNIPLNLSPRFSPTFAATSIITPSYGWIGEPVTEFFLLVNSGYNFDSFGNPVKIEEDFLWSFNANSRKFTTIDLTEDQFEEPTDFERVEWKFMVPLEEKFILLMGCNRNDKEISLFSYVSLLNSEDVDLCGRESNVCEVLTEKNVQLPKTLLSRNHFSPLQSSGFFSGIECFFNNSGNDLISLEVFNELDEKLKDLICPEGEEYFRVMNDIWKVENSNLYEKPKFVNQGVFLPSIGFSVFIVIIAFLSGMYCKSCRCRCHQLLYSVDAEDTIRYDPDDPETFIGLSKEMISLLESVPVEKLEAKFMSQDCAICLNGFTTASTVKMLPCGHVFCEACIDHWLYSKGSCPICKLNIRVWLRKKELKAEVVIS